MPACQGEGDLSGPERPRDESRPFLANFHHGNAFLIRLSQQQGGDVHGCVPLGPGAGFLNQAQLSQLQRLATGQQINIKEQKLKTD